MYVVIFKSRSVLLHFCHTSLCLIKSSYFWPLPRPVNWEIPPFAHPVTYAPSSKSPLCTGVSINNCTVQSVPYFFQFNEKSQSLKLGDKHLNMNSIHWILSFNYIPQPTWNYLFSSWGVAMTVQCVYLCVQTNRLLNQVSDNKNLMKLPRYFNLL